MVVTQGRKIVLHFLVIGILNLRIFDSTYTQGNLIISLVHLSELFCNWL